MVKSEILLDYLKNEMSEYFSSNNLQYTIAFHDEMSINSYSNIEVVIKSLPGTITNNRITYPIQIIVEVENEYFDEVKDALTDFTIQKNENLFTVENFEDYKIKQFFSTPTVLSLFNENGSNHTTTLSIDSTFIVFEGAIFSNDTYVKIDNQLLENIIAINYNLINSCDSSVRCNDNLAKNYVNGTQIALSIDVDFSQKNELHKKIMRNKTKNVKYKVKYFDGFIEEEYEMIISSVTANISVGGTMQGRLSFVVAGD